LPTRSQQVFINCPFDRQYKPLFDAIVFTLHDLGYVALYALNKRSGGALRLPRIHKQLGDCAYSIHDLSRVSLSGPLRLPRFNMPFEAGVAYAMHAASLPRRRHELLLLDAKAHRYQASISDLAGLDPQNHNNNAMKAIEAVRTFFAQHNPGKRYNVAPFIQRRYLTFSGHLPAKAREMRFSTRLLRSWDYALDLQTMMAAWIQENP
jgi:hypothetical protein